MAQDLKRITESNFYLGYNDRDKPEALRNPEQGIIYMAMIQNGFVDEGKIKKRKGYAMIANAPAAKMILGEDRHEPHGGSKYILRARNDSTDTNALIEGWSGSGNWVGLTGAAAQTAGLYHTFAMANNATYIFNGTNTVLKTINGTSATTVATIPIGLGGVWFHNYFFVFGVAGNLSRLYFSNIGDPETFNPTTGYLDVNPGDNEPITTIDVLKDELLIFKPSRTWSLTGFGTADFTLEDLGERGTSIGTYSPYGVVSVGNDIYYLSYRGSIPHFRSFRKTEDGQVVDSGVLSDAIQGTMERVNTVQLRKVVGEFDGRRIWWAVPMDSATENNEVLVLDTITGGWTKHTGIKASAIHISTITGETEVYFGSSEADGKSHKLNSGTNDDGDAIDFVVETPYYNPQPGYQSRYKYMYLTADTSTGSTLDVDYSTDGFDWVDLATVDLTGSGIIYGYGTFGSSRFGDTTILKHRIDYAGGAAYFMQYRYSNDNLNEDVTLRGWELFYYDKGLRSTPY